MILGGCNAVGRPANHTLTNNRSEMAMGSPGVGTPNPSQTPRRDDRCCGRGKGSPCAALMTTVAALIVTALVAAGSAAANGAVEEGSCVSCHSSIPQDPGWQHSYSDWKDSLHANSNVDCHSCHGGDDHAASADEAHAGMAPVGGGATPSDRLTAARVCGSCHPTQYWGFTHSRHFQLLVDGQRAAYCHTCHTSVGSRVLTPVTIGATCAQCHRDSGPGNIPDAATALLTHLYEVRTAVTFRDPASKLSPKQWATVTQSATTAMAAWHKFDLPAVGVALADGTELLER